MNFKAIFNRLFGNQFTSKRSRTQFGKTGEKTTAEYNRELLIRQGRDQFTKLVEKGLNVPIALL